MNAGLSVLQAATAFETVAGANISGYTNEVEDCSKNLDTIVKLLEILKRDSAGGGDVDYRTQPTKQALIDQLYEISPHLLRADLAEHGDRYRWTKEHCEDLIDSLKHEPQRFHDQINQTMAKITQKFQERNQITDIVSEILKELRESVRSFLSRIGH